MSRNVYNFNYHIPSLGEIRKLLSHLGYSRDYIENFIEQIKHFEKEAPKRDNIVESYLTKSEIENVVESIVVEIEEKNKEPLHILDIGAGSGYFTVKVRKKLIERGFGNICIYGLDLSPSMLERLARRKIIPLWGIAENLTECLKVWIEKHEVLVPERFDYIMSTLAFHHFLDLEKALSNIREIIVPNGKVIVIDIKRYQNEDLMKKLGDTRPGLDPNYLEKIAKKYFNKVEIKTLENARCCTENVSINLFKGVFQP